jgi:hypothetical protein
MMTSSITVRRCYLAPIQELENNDKMCSLSSFTIAKKKKKRMITNNVIARCHCFLIRKELEQRRAATLLAVVTWHLLQNLSRAPRCLFALARPQHNDDE